MKFNYCDKMRLVLEVFFVLCFMRSSCTAGKEVCGFPGTPAYGKVEKSLASYEEGDTVIYDCEVGYILIGSSISRCRNGSWTEDVPVCDDSMTTLISAESTATVPGYPKELAIDKNKQKCTYLQPKKPRWWRIDLGGEKTYKVLTVAITMMNLDKYLKFTVFVIKTEKNIANYRRCASFSGKFGTPTIILSCAEGKGIEGKKVHIEDHNPLDGLFEICEIEIQVERDNGYDCGAPSRNLYSLATVMNNVVEYECLRGYKLVGNEYRTCLKTGQWSDTPPLCEPIVCEGLDPLENGNITFHHGNSGPILEGATAIYKCESGYKLSGPFTRNCAMDGTWSGTTPKCKAIRCPIPDGSEVGGVYRLMNKTNSMGSMAVLRCKGGKVEGDNPYITCTENGEWTPAEAFCVIPARATIVKPQPPRIAYQGGIIFGMVVAAVMIVVVLVGLYLYGQMRRNNKPEIPSRLIEPPSPPPRPPPRVKENSFKTAFKGFLNRENSDSDKQALKESWKTQSLPSNQAQSDNASPKKALSYGETFPGENENDAVIEVEVLAPDHSKVKGTYPSVPEEPENAAFEEVALEMEGEESANDSSAKSPGPDYAAVDYEKKRQSRVLKEQESMESSTSAAASPLPDDESDARLASHSPTPPKRISESEGIEEEEEEEETEESEESKKLNVTDTEDSQKDSYEKMKEELKKQEEEEKKAKEEMEQKLKEEEERKKAEEERKKEEEKKKESDAPVPGSRRRRIRDEPAPPAAEEKPVLRRLRRFQ